MPNKRQKQAARYRYNMKYKARKAALSPSEMSAAALARNEEEEE